MKKCLGVSNMNEHYTSILQYGWKWHISACSIEKIVVVPIVQLSNLGTHNLIPYK